MPPNAPQDSKPVELPANATNWERFAATLDPKVSEIVPYYTVANGGISYTVGGGTGFDGVVELTMNHAVLGSISCTGCLLASGWDVITAGHCLADGNGKATTLGGQPFSTNIQVRFHLAGGVTQIPAAAAYIVHPSYNGVGSQTPDLGVVRLTARAPDAAERREIYRSSGELFSTVTQNGYGLTGTGAAGFTAGTGGTRRGNSNELEALAESLNGKVHNGTTPFPLGTFAPNLLMVQDFDNGTAANNALAAFTGASGQGLGNAEVCPYKGDSGGPCILGGKLAGVVFGGSGFTYAGSPDILSGTNGSFGELAYYTRMSLFQTWHDQTVPPTVRLVTASRQTGATANYDIPTSNGLQLKNVPFGLVNRFVINFTEDCAPTASPSVVVQGTSGIYNVTTQVFARHIVVNLNLAVHSAFQYTNVGKLVPGEKLTITVQNIAKSVASGAQLDGSWTNPDSVLNGTTNGSGQTISRYPSGDATLGGNFVFRVITLPADFNLDNKVDLTDFGIVQANFGTGTTHAQGDADGDGDVDINDFGIMKDSQGTDWTNF